MGSVRQAQSAAADKYYIRDALLKPAAHHQSFEQLWETKWKAPVRSQAIWSTVRIAYMD